MNTRKECQQSGDLKMEYTVYPVSKEVQDGFKHLVNCSKIDLDLFEKSAELPSEDLIDWVLQYIMYAVKNGITYRKLLELMAIRPSEYERFLPLMNILNALNDDEDNQ